MKHLITALLIFASLSCFGQQQPKDTTKTIPIHYNEYLGIVNQFNKASTVLFSVDMSTKKRDSIVFFLNNITYFLGRRMQTTYDTVKEQTKKPIK